MPYILIAVARGYGDINHGNDIITQSFENEDAAWSAVDWLTQHGARCVVVNDGEAVQQAAATSDAIGNDDEPSPTPHDEEPPPQQKRRRR